MATPVFLDLAAFLWGVDSSCLTTPDASSGGVTVSIPDQTPGSDPQGSLETSCLGLSDNHYPIPPSPAVGVSSRLTADVQLW